MEAISERNAALLETFFRSAGLDFVRSQEGGVPRFDVRRGKHRAVVKTYHTGVVLVQGSDSPLKVFLMEIKQKLENGEDIT